MKIFSYDGPLFRFFDKVGCLLLLNLVFLTTCIPVVTIGVSVTALYSCLLAMVSGDYTGTLKRYFSSFKSNFKSSLLLSLCILPFLLLALCDALLFFSAKASVGTGRLFIAFFPVVLVFFMLSYVFPLQAQFENTVFNTIKNSLLFALGNFPTTLCMTAVNLIFPLTAIFLPELFLRTFPFWVLYGFSLPALLNARLLRKIFTRYMPEESKDEI